MLVFFFFFFFLFYYTKEGLRARRTLTGTGSSRYHCDPRIIKAPAANRFEEFEGKNRAMMKMRIVYTPPILDRSFCPYSHFLYIHILGSYPYNPRFSLYFIVIHHFQPHKTNESSFNDLLRQIGPRIIFTIVLLLFFSLLLHRWTIRLFYTTLHA